MLYRSDKQGSWSLDNEFKYIFVTRIILEVCKQKHVANQYSVIVIDQSK